MIKHYIYILLALLSISCTPAPKDAIAVETLPDIYPDYCGVTVPVNIAPLNFMLRTPCEAIYVVAEGGAVKLKADCDGAEARFDTKDWHKLLKAATSDDVTVTVSARIDGKWYEYEPFYINVSPDPIDAYMSYRLIEPDYEVFSRLQIMERCLEDFSERPLCDYNQVGDRCMNCHTYNAGCGGDQSFLYVRGEGGGMILNEGGCLRKLNLKADGMPAGSVYGQLSPSGRWLVFSANVIIPGFHSKPSRRLEVFDTKSSVYVADLKNNRIMCSPALSDSTRLATFPAFSPDGKSIYYCVSDGPVKLNHIDSLQYHLCRVDFDDATGAIGSAPDTIVHARVGEKSSVSHPRLAPDGRHLLYTVADYGTFPIWHREADLRMVDLTTGRVDTLAHVNSAMSDTYHAWSSDGHWFVFASKRDDGLFGKPYFCHVDAAGSVSKPFVLPQLHPRHYDHNLKSYNVPELSPVRVSFTAADVADALDFEAESFVLVNAPLVEY